MGKELDVSIVIPTLNEEKYIEKCLRSVRAQNYSGSFEIIVADGYSLDRTVKIAEKYANKIVFEHTHTIAAGRQAGAKAASGKVIVYTGADVVLPVDWLQRLVAPFADRRVAAAYGSLMPLDGTWFDNVFCRFFINPMAGILNAAGLMYVYGDNMAFRKSTFDQISGFDIRLVTAEDTDIMRRIKKFGKAEYVPRARTFFSMRRVRKWGALYYFGFHFLNFFRANFFGSAAKKYEPVR
jgi:glycosyltransferase involved in cell wall biosynthesis